MIGIVYLLSVWVVVGVCSMMQRELVTHHSILAINRLAHFRHSLMRIYGHGVSGSSYGLSACCYCASFGRQGVRVQSQLGLGSKFSVTTKWKYI